MNRSSIVRYLNPWKFRREEHARRLSELKARDGDNCRRCRRPMRFDLPQGHDSAPRIEPIAANGDDNLDDLGDLCLTHVRCHASGADHTGEVTERMRRRNEAALLSKRARRGRSKAA